MTTLFIVILIIVQLFSLIHERAQNKIIHAKFESLENLVDFEAHQRLSLSRRLDDLEKKSNDRNGFELTKTDHALSGIRIDIMNLQKQHDELRSEFEEEVSVNDSSLTYVEDQIKQLQDILIYQVTPGSDLAGLQERVSAIVKGNDDRRNEGENQSMETGLESGMDRQSPPEGDDRDLQPRAREDRPGHHA